jgi:phage repressor protein C with HTH and peptisase S24 domain
MCQHVLRYSIIAERDEIWRMKIGDKIKAARKAKKLTQEALTDLCGWAHQSRISGYERGEREPSFEDLEVLAQALGLVSAQELVTFGDTRVGEPAATYAVSPAVVAVTSRAIPLSATIHGEKIHAGEDLEKEPMYFQASWIRKMGFKPEMLVTRQVKGSSMEPTLWDGDMILINCESREPKHGRTYWVEVEGEPCVKRILKLHGEWWISSDNETQRLRDMQLENPQQIMGEVVIKSSSHI